MKKYPVINTDHSVQLTPAGKPIYVPTQTLASNISANPNLAKLAVAAIDDIPRSRKLWMQQIRRQAHTDLLCYPANSPESLLLQQEKIWTPIRNWAASNGVKLQTSPGLLPASQPAQSLDTLEEIIQNMDDFMLAGFVRCMALTQSVLLALACAHQHISTIYAHEAAQLHENWQAKRWGQITETTNRKYSLLCEMKELQQWFNSLKPLAASSAP